MRQSGSWSVLREFFRSRGTGALRQFGYQIHKLPQTTSFDYEAVRPLATYAPWNKDPEFQATYNSVKANTLVDLYRCWELWCLVEQSSKVPGSILEVGVWRGGTAALLCRKAQLCGIQDPVYLCDTFRGVVKADARDRSYRGGEHSDAARQAVESFICGQLGLENARILEGIFPDETGHLIRDPVFRLCHIDVDVHKSAQDTFRWVWPRMSVGGIVVFDDYGFEGCDGVTEVVEHELRGQKDRIVLHNLNGHAVIVKITGSNAA